MSTLIRQEYKVGGIFETKKARVFSANVWPSGIFVSIVECDGHWINTKMSPEMFKRFCEIIGFPEFALSDEARDKIVDLPVYTRDREVRGIWRQKLPGYPWRLEIISFPLADGVEN